MKFKTWVTEANKGEDIIKVTVPMFIKLMEWSREDAKSDLDVHNITERIVSKNGILCSSEFDDLIKNI